MRVFIVFCLFLSFVFGVERPKFEDFLACFEKNKASMMNYEGMNAFALNENHLAVIKKPNAKLNKYVKYDPFLNLYLVKTDFSLFPAATYDEQNLTRNDWVGILDNNRSYIGHLKYLALNLNERDQLDFATKIGQVSTPCCSMLGISLGDGSFIGNRYLKHFAKYNDVYWGDIGVDFALREGKIYVQKVRSNGQFLLNDEIVSVDGQAPASLRELNEKILFADRGSTMYFNVLRDNEDLNISANVFAKDLSGFNLTGDKNVKKPNLGLNTLFGLTINSAKVITKIDPGSKAALAGFVVGDEILRINNAIMKTNKDIQNAFAGANDFSILIARKSKNLPIERQNLLDSYETGDNVFQFFIRLTK